MVKQFALVITVSDSYQGTIEDAHFWVENALRAASDSPEVHNIQSYTLVEDLIDDFRNKRMQFSEDATPLPWHR